MRNLFVALFVFTAISSAFAQENHPDFLDREDQLLEDVLGKFGRGNDQFFYGEDFSYKSPIHNLETVDEINSSIERGMKNFRQYFIPLVKETFPEMLEGKNENLTYLLKKTQKAAMINYLLIDGTAVMFGEQGMKVHGMANLWFSVAHPIYDAMFDLEIPSLYTREENIQRATQIIRRDFNLSEPVQPIERLLISIVQRLIKNMPARNVEPFFVEMERLNTEQIHSHLQQVEQNLSDDTLRRITFRKGGFSMKLYALLADREFTQSEMDLFFLEGAMLQCVDDLFDIEEDSSVESNRTLVNSFLVTPKEVVKMRDIVYGRLRQLVNDGVYNKSGVRRHKVTIDLFVSEAIKTYEASPQIQCKRFEGRSCATVTTIKIAEGIESVLDFILGAPKKLLMSALFPSMSVLE